MHVVHRLGSPQGGVLSPILFLLSTRVCGSSQANGRVVKHADDTVLLALLSSSEYDDSHALLEFSACRDGAGLQGNISKTKEMAI
ncbi:RNA-directed DNA polymerase from mobile element jockey-like protein [Labeo rohita]|uniref:RNA-directed DNA polymerase from mobile element jockey-like protein n=1 Tax=Labeo rohita TaxID=84645 RepID=A0A498MA96_LABRO|nr:RNA-directed DNA polymerase from mobile element jockey-like protein [Labeo rohita]RXN14450.1 RNA-directed DNA polymerase from mobile element jockey-like protein [Labeo rohita]